MKKILKKLLTIFHLCELHMIQVKNDKNQPWRGTHEECSICGHWK